MRATSLPALLLLGVALACCPARRGGARVASPALACPGGRLAFQAGQEVDAALAVFTRWAEHWRRARVTPGMSMVIVRAGEVIYAHDFGLADVEARQPAGPHTRYRLASLTKLLTAAAVLRLWEADRLDLDGPIQRLVPDLAAVPGRRAPTVRDLLRHTSGLPRDFAPAYFTDAPIPSRAQTRAQIALLHQDLPAGKVAKYSNAAYAVLGEAVAAASGVPYETYLAREVLAPLGMAATELAPEAAGADLAAGYGEGFGASAAARRVPFRPAGALTAAGGATATAADVARLAAMWLGHAPQVIGARARTEACTPQWHDDDEDWDQGLPLFMVERDGLRHLRHTGSLDGYTSAIDLVPALDLGVVVLTNAADGAPQTYARQAISVLRLALDHAQHPEPAAAAAAPDCAHLGDYGFGEVRQLIVQHGAELYMLAPGDDDAAARPTRLTPAGPDALMMEGGAWTGELLRFCGPPGAPATEMAVNGIRWPRLPTP